MSVKENLTNWSDYNQQDEDFKTVRNLKTQEEVELWLNRHGYGPVLADEVVDRWKAARTTKAAPKAKFVGKPISPTVK